MKKHLLINIHYLEIGGAETSLIGLLHTLNGEEVSVDLMLNDRRGEMLKYVPKWVNIIEVPKEYAMIERPVKEVVQKRYWKIAIARLWAKYKFNRYYKKKNPIDGSAVFGFVAKYTTPVLPELKHLGEYDVAISYLSPHDIVLNKVKAKKKVCWIHTDYSSIDLNKPLELPVWNGYDKIISISDKVSESFCSVFPELKSKLLEIENFLPVDLIRSRAEEYIPSDMRREKDELLLLSIGRYCEAKNFDLIPFLCRYLLDQGIKLKWYIIGYGAEMELNKIIDEIKRYKVEKEVVLLGKKENPYPYIKTCDWYVQPSRYEGKSVTVREAQMLATPVIIRNYPTAGTQVRNGIDGLITGFEKEEFARNLAEFIEDDKIREKIIGNCRNLDFNNPADIVTINELFQEECQESKH